MQYRFAVNFETLSTSVFFIFKDKPLPYDLVIAKFVLHGLVERSLLLLLTNMILKVHLYCIEHVLANVLS